MNDALERVLRTLTQSAFGLSGGIGIQDATHITGTSLTGELIVVACILCVAIIMNHGPKWLRPIVTQIVQDETDKTS